jgi:uncharacterized protein involved in exopolysaccharide biosynthesis
METNIRQDNNEEVEIDIMQIIRMLLSKIWIVIVLLFGGIVKVEFILFE